MSTSLPAPSAWGSWPSLRAIFARRWPVSRLNSWRMRYSSLRPLRSARSGCLSNVCNRARDRGAARRSVAPFAELKIGGVLAEPESNSEMALGLTATNGAGTGVILDFDEELPPALLDQLRTGWPAPRGRGFDRRHAEQAVRIDCLNLSHAAASLRRIASSKRAFVCRAERRAEIVRRFDQRRTWAMNGCGSTPLTMGNVWRGGRGGTRAEPGRREFWVMDRSRRKCIRVSLSV